jgi:hypothetical protein
MNFRCSACVLGEFAVGGILADCKFAVNAGLASGANETRAANQMSLFGDDLILIRSTSVAIFPSGSWIAPPFGIYAAERN